MKLNLEWHETYPVRDNKRNIKFMVHINPLEAIEKTSAAQLDLHETTPLATVVEEKEESKGDPEVRKAYYRDTLASAKENIPSASSQENPGRPSKVAIENDSRKVSLAIANPSIYYQDTITPIEKKAVGLEISPVSAKNTPKNVVEEAQKVISNVQEQEGVQPLRNVQDPQAPDAEDIEKFRSAMGTFVSQITGEDGKDAVQLIEEMYRLLIEFQESASDYASAKAKKEFTEEKKLKLERLKKFEEVLEKAKETKTWNQFEAATKALGLAATGIGASSGLGMVLFVFAVGLTVDQVADDWFKKGVAGLISNGNSASKDWWTSVFQMGAGAITSAATISANGVDQGLKLILESLKLTTSAVGEVKKYQSTSEQKVLLGLNFKLEEKDRKLKSAIDDIKRTIEKVQTLYRQRGDALRLNNDAVALLFR